MIKRLALQEKHMLLYALVIVCLFFLTKWIFQGAYFQADLVINTIPLENLHGHIQRAGQSPLWAPELAGGYPLLASAQLGFWYPPHMLLRQFLPGVWTLNISLLLHALLGATGIYFFAKHNKLSSIAAATAAVLFPLCGAFVGKYSSLNLVLPFMWAPLLFLLLQLFIERGGIKLLTVWIGANALCVLIGHPQMVLYVMVSEVLFLLCLFSFSIARWQRTLAVLFGFALALTLTSFYILPIVTNIQNTDRAAGSLRQNPDGRFDYQFTPEAFWGLLLPHPFGHHTAYHGPTNESEMSSYFGPIALLFAGIGMFVSKKSSPVLWRFSIVLVIIGLSLAIGSASPLFMWFVSHGWNLFNAPSRFFLYTTIGLVLLVGAGLDYFRASLRPYLAVAALVPVLIVGWFWHEGVPWKFTKEPELAQFLQEQGGFTRVFSGKTIAEVAPDSDFGIKAWNPVCSTCVYRQTFTSPFESINGIAVKFSSAQKGDGIVTLKLYSNNGELLREATAENSSIVDSEWSTFTFQTIEGIVHENLYLEITSNMEREKAPRLLIHTNPGEHYDPSGGLYNCVKKTCTEVKTYDAAYKVISDSKAVPYYDALAPYVSAGFGVGTMQWSGSLSLGAVKEYLRPVGTWGDPLGDGARTVINRAATTHMIGLFPPYRHAGKDDGLSLIKSIPQGSEFLELYTNEEVFPRVSFVQNVRALSDRTDQINTMIKLPPTDQSTVVADLTEDRVFPEGENTAQIVRDERTRVGIHTKQQTEGLLVLRDVLVPDWKATIDGNSAHIYRVDGIFRGLLIPAGEHTVMFEYKPSWMKPVLWLSGVSAIIFTILIWGSVVRHIPLRQGYGGL